MTVCLLFAPFVGAEQGSLAPEFIHDVPILTAEEVVGRILANPDLVVIDSRKSAEFKKGHIEGALNVVNTELLEAKLLEIAPDKTIELLFYCDGVRCLRSSDSITKARAWGYENLYWFRGGWEEWTGKMLPIVIQ
jgi:rhodanese-related sulfurtransferase